jgi:hypothetical protein
VFWWLPGTRSFLAPGMNLSDSLRPIPHGGPLLLRLEHFDLIAETDQPQDHLVDAFHIVEEQIDRSVTPRAEPLAGTAWGVSDGRGHSRREPELDLVSRGFSSDSGLFQVSFETESRRDRIRFIGQLEALDARDLKNSDLTVGRGVSDQ